MHNTIHPVLVSSQHTASLNGEIVSTIITTITAIAIAVILIAYIQGLTFGSVLPALVVLGSIGSTSFITQLICRYCNYRNAQKLLITQDARDQQTLNFSPAPTAVDI